MVFIFFRRLFFSGIAWYIVASGDLRCRLTTNLGPRLVASPRDKLILNCSSVSGNDSVYSIKWRHNGTTLNASSSILSRNNVTWQDAGKYECTLVKGNETSQQCVVSVEVYTLPRLTLSCGNPSGNIFKLKCLFQGFSKPEFVWYKNGIKIIPSKRNYLKIDSKTISVRSYRSNLQKDFPSKSDNGNYSCKVNYKNGESLIDNCSVTDIGDDIKCPEFEFPRRKQNITIHVGMTVTMLCTVIHASPKNLDIYKFTKKTLDENHIYTDFKNHKKVVMNYTIVSATKNDTREYTCIYHRLHKTECNLPLKKTFILHVDSQPAVSSRTKKKVYIAVAVSVTGTLIGLGLVMLVFVRKKKLNSQRFYDSLPELRWDVFVSYSSKDFLWVKNLCETLEAPPFNLVVCLHQRDWELGRAVIDNMADSVYCSQKTLIIMSKHYLESSYCMQELQIAMHSEMCRNFSKESIVLIKIDDVSVKKLPRALRQKSYLDFSNNEQRKHFKAKLLKALPRKNSICEINNTIEEMCRNVCDEGNAEGNFHLSNVTSDTLT